MFLTCPQLLFTPPDNRAVFGQQFLDTTHRICYCIVQLAFLIARQRRKTSRLVYPANGAFVVRCTIGVNRDFFGLLVAIPVEVRTGFVAIGTAFTDTSAERVVFIFPAFAFGCLQPG